MRVSLFLIPFALSSVACSSPAEMEEATGVEGEAVQRTSARAEATPSAFTDNEERDGGSREFSYQWPAAVTAQPALARLLRAERDRLLAQEKVEWTDALADSPQDCVSCRSRSFGKEWKVAADTPGLMSLSGEFSSYTGGAHGMYGLESLVWDKAAQRAVSGVELFQSPEALDAALGDKLCRALNAEREERRGEPVPPPTADDMGFNSCPSVSEATVLVGSSTGKAFDRIGIWFGPYVAGSYAEGAYELDFPVDAAVLRAVKPEYAAAFAPR
ncbi:MAG TPA: hypothetical protein VFS87_08020 [Qipengyuania sp.]|nr:hypothetical protein [Qipengyuania sp.]